MGKLIAILIFALFVLILMALYPIIAVIMGVCIILCVIGLVKLFTER